VPLPEGVRSAYDLWPRAMRFDDGGRPYLKVTDEASGNLYRIDFTVSGSDVTFGEFTPVVEQDVPVAAGARIMAPVASWNTREAARLAASASNHEEGQVPIDLAALRTRLGLAEDADEAAINAALEAPQPDPEPDPAPDPQPDPQPDPTPAPANVPEGMVLVDAEQFAAVRQGAEQGAEVAARLARQDRDDAIRAAIGEGRFSPSRREHYAQMWDRDPEGTRILLTASADQGGLAPGLVPVTAEMGAAGDGEGTGVPEDAGTGWFNFEQQGA